MIADQTDQAIRLADEALALATSLELEELQAHTLNTRGVARTLNGDLGGVEDLERAVEIAPPLSFELMRALNNLVSTLVELGDLERGFALDGPVPRGGAPTRTCRCDGVGRDTAARPALLAR